jgi:hypothetical protein
LGLEGHNNVGLKMQACQSQNGRVLSLNRHADIGLHPAPQVHPKYSLYIKNKPTPPALLERGEGTYLYFTSCGYSNN